ncbi:hypothetical protein ACFQ0K_09110 [Nocardioides caeni]|uniref:hypothetical protein n=1 Tax=Nocardioides caeni TaxID=574700 RepID=UPI0013053ECD|nr:hypothetical protein [Nocardioides caeni]
MTGTLLDQVRRLDRAERRWLADARDRLRRTRPSGATPPAATGTTRKETRR